MNFPLKVRNKVTKVQTTNILNKEELLKFLTTNFSDFYYDDCFQAIMFKDFKLFDMEFPKEVYKDLFGIIILPEEEEYENDQEQVSTFCEANHNLCVKFLYDIVVSRIETPKTSVKKNKKK